MTRTALAAGPDDGEWMSTQEAARALHISTRELYRLIDTGALPPHRHGRVIKLRRSDIETFLPEPPAPALYKADGQSTLYDGPVTRSGDLRVSSRGQMSLPAGPRHRWDLADGGEVGYLDLGDALLLVPGGIRALRRELLDAITEADWRAAAAGFGDPDLADE